MKKNACLALVALLLLAAAASAQKLEMYSCKRENRDGLRKLVRQFEAENKGININLLFIEGDADAILSARAEQGRLSDILLLPSYAPLFEFAAKGYLVDLTKQSALGKTLDAAKAPVSWGGKAWALPLDFNGIGILYNKDIFSKNKVTPPTSYRDLERVCKTLMDIQVLPFAPLVKSDWALGHFLSLVHTGLLAEKKTDTAKFLTDMNAGKTSYGAVDAKKLLAYIDFFRSYSGKNAQDMDWAEQQAEFAAGRAAMMIQGLWSWRPALLANPKLNCGFIPFPVSNDSKLNRFYADVDSCIALSSQSSPAESAAALKFLEWLAEPGAQKILIEDCRLASAFKGADLKALGAPWVELMTSIVKNGSLPWAFAAYPRDVFEGPVKQGARQYFLGKMKAEDVVAGIDREWTAAAGGTKK